MRPTKNPAGLGRGSLPTNGRHSRETYNMMIAKTEERESRPIASSTPKVGSMIAGVVREGRMSIDPSLAARILNETNYIRQRKLKPFRLHRHKTTISRGQWDPDNTIRFARFAGQLILVDGQHRLNAVIETNTACSFIVVISEAKSSDDVHRMYSRIDVDGNRSVVDVLNAADPTNGRDISFEMRRGAYKAMDVLANDFPHRRLKVGEAELVTREDRVNCMAFWLEELEDYDAIVRSGQSQLRNAMRRPGIIAVALATLKHQGERARLFWSSVADNKLLRPGDPEQALVNFLLTSRMDDAMRQGERYTAQAWNAWFHGRRLEKIRKSPGDDKPIKIAGTPFQGIS